MSWSISISRATVPVLITLLALSTTGCKRAKTRLDREVDRLCAIDGGVHIYETVKLSKENFGPDGEVFPQYRAEVASGAGLGPEFKWTSVTKRIVDADPSLTRWETTITRVNDAKVIAREIRCVRGGGDLPGPWAPSSHACSHVSLDLYQVFFKEESK